MKIDEVKEMKILGYWFNESMDNNKYLIKNFETVRKSFFALNMFGMKPNGLNPFLQAFLYNTFCLSKSTYSIELMNINEKSLNILNVMQNGIVRYLLKLNKTCHMSNILKSLKILNMKHLICKYQINFVKQIENHQVCKNIFNNLLKCELKEKTNSFIKDINFISKTINCNKEEVGKLNLRNKQLERLEEKIVKF